MLSRVRTAVLAAGVALPLALPAQPALALLESYGRVVALLSFMTVHVGELLLACSAKNVISEDQVEARFRAYRERNAVLLERAERWSQAAEKRLEAQGEGRAAQRQADDSGLSAMAAASAQAQGQIGNAGDARAAC